MQIDIDKLIDGAFFEISDAATTTDTLEIEEGGDRSEYNIKPNPFEQLASSKQLKSTKVKKSINIWKESLRVVLVIGISFLVGDVFTNFDLYAQRAKELIHGQAQVTYSKEDKEQLVEETTKTKNQQILSLFSNIKKE